MPGLSMLLSLFIFGLSLFPGLDLLDPLLSSFRIHSFIVLGLFWRFQTLFLGIVQNVSWILIAFGHSLFLILFLHILKKEECFVGICVQWCRLILGFLEVFYLLVILVHLSLVVRYLRISLSHFDLMLLFFMKLKFSYDL